MKNRPIALQRPIVPARSSGWGAACDSCARAKVRCHRSSPVVSSCDRCQSLNKNCTQQVTKPRKPRQSKPQTAKLDNLLQSLKSGDTYTVLDSLHVPGDNDADYTSPADASSSSLTTKSPSQRQVEEDDVTNSPMPGFNSFARQPCTCRMTVDKEYLNPVEPDDTLLSIYTTQLSPRFPFVIIPPGTIASQLHREKPFLMKVIRMVASLRHRQSMWGQRHAVMRHIADAVIVRSERSLDLLQGILVFLGYYNYYCLAHGQLNSLTHMATSMVADLGLDRRTRPRPRSRYQAMDPDVPKDKTNEEKRAAVGVWYMCSNAALTFNKLDSPRYTRDMDQCLRELEEAAEYKLDETLVHLVRVQLLTERIFQFVQRSQLVYELPTTSLSPDMYISALEAELDKVQDSIPRRLKNDYLLSSHFSTARLRLLESHLANAETLTPAATAALETWFDKWLSIPVCYYFYMPIPGFGHLIYTVTMLARRARILVLARDESDSDTNNYAGDDLMLDVLEALAKRFESAREEMCAAHGGEWNNDLLDLAGRRLRVIGARIERWSNIVAANSRARQPRKDQPVYDGESQSEMVNEIDRWWPEQTHGPWMDEYHQDHWLWATNIFSGMDLDFGEYSSWATGSLENEVLRS
ncbi:hypothetical protein V1507DRAFT_76960 [Lipomyces tetrasporus]